jgi:hypothetical protein
MYYLKDVLIPFLLALALKYLLTPLIDCLACQDMKCRFRLPRALAVLLAILVAFLGMVVIALILARSLSTFKSKSDFYGYRVQQLALREYITLRDFLPSDMKRSLDHLNVSAEINKALAEIKIGNLILDLLGTAGALVANCSFERLDGNGLFLDAWNRDAAVLGNEFAWIGNTAIALWGVTADSDATAGKFTRPAWRIKTPLTAIVGPKDQRPPVP